MEFTLAIPARYGSSRFPGKVLADLGGKPVLQHVWERAKRVRGAQEIVVLTESEKVKDAVESWGGICWMTPESCSNGTERIAAVLERIPSDFIFNIQADEPFIQSELLEAMIRQTQQSSNFDLLTPIYSLEKTEDLFNPNIVKVVRQQDGEALYFSRSPIPYLRGVQEDKWIGKTSYWGHLGIYLYRRSLLENLHSIPQSPLAVAESLEQLRFLQSGYRIQTILASERAVAIDVEADLLHARKLLAGK